MDDLPYVAIVSPDIGVTDELFFSEERYNSPLAIGSINSDFDLKNSDWDHNFDNSRKTSFNLEPELYLLSPSQNNPSNLRNEDTAEIDANLSVKRQTNILKASKSQKKAQKNEDKCFLITGKCIHEGSEDLKIKKTEAGSKLSSPNPSISECFEPCDKLIACVKPSEKSKHINELSYGVKTTKAPSGSRFINCKLRPSLETRDKKKAKRVRKKKREGCTCKTINCLKLHCVCFKNLGHCGAGCKCTGCLNKVEFESTRKFAIEKTKLIFSNAFTALESTTATDINGDCVQIFSKGCKCKTGCWKNYCDCKKANGRCSYICKCMECENNKVELPKDEIKRIFKPVSRKKHKLVINYEPKRAAHGKKNIIEFKKYKNAYIEPDDGESGDIQPTNN